MIASDGNSFFAVWEQNGARSSIAGTRVSAEGIIADPAGIPIGESPGSDHDPSVIWNGATYVVVFWTDEPYGAKLVELSRDGNVIRELQPVEGLVRRVRIAWNGSVYLLAWIENPVSLRLRLRILDRGFQRIGQDQSIETAFRDLEVASNGTNFLVVWTGKAAMVSADGSVAPPFDVPAPLAIASDGVSYAIALRSEVIAVSNEGNVTKHVPLAIEDAPAIAWDGSHYLVAGTRDYLVCGAELDAALNVTRVPVPLLSEETGQDSPALVSSGTQTILTWSDIHIRAALFERGAFATGPAAASFVVSTGLADQIPVDALWTNDILNVLWQEEEILRFGQVTATGTRLSGEGRALGRGYGRLAWNGSLLAVVMEHDGVIEVCRLSATGEPLDAPLRAGSGRGARIASNGRDFAIAWITPEGNIATAMFTASGAITLPRTVQPLHPGPSLFGIVPKNDSYVLFYLTRSPGQFFSCTYVSLPLSADGSYGIPGVLDSASNVSAFTGAATGAIASNGSRVAYAWTVSPHVENGIHMQIDDGPATFIAGQLTADAIAWDGPTPVIVYSDSARRFFRRGDDTFELPRSSVWKFAAAPGRAAYVWGAETPEAMRATVRFFLAPRRRSVR